MAKKSLILSNNDGRVTFSNTGSLWYDDVTLSITGSEISASSIAFAGISVNKLMYVSGSSILPVVTGTVNNGALVWNATTSQWSASADIVEYYTGSAGGDLSGTFGQIGFPVVKNISNVSSGTLSAFYGGTGANIPTGTNILLKATSGSFTYLSASAASSGSLVTATSQNGWTLAPPAYQPDVRFYTSGSTGNTFTWTKPTGARFARVILQGAGGGGGGSTSNNAPSALNGGGGGAGAFTDVTIEISSVSSASVTTGIGGNGGICNVVASTTNGLSGSITSFTTNAGTVLSANAGLGGVRTSGANTNAGGAGGTAMSVANGGYSKTGDAGATGGAAQRTVYAICGGGGAGGWYNRSIITPIIQSTSFGYSTTSDGVNLSMLTFASGTNGNLTTPERAGYGGGGAAAVAGSTVAPTQRAAGVTSDHGGHGYVLVISW